MMSKFMALVMVSVITTSATIYANEGMPAPVEGPAAPAENVTQGAPTTPAMSADSTSGKDEKKRDLARRRHKRKHRRHRRRHR